MRIQHNIMAMNAYRNYNNNTSALSKNLEKLSSGYKINRAGDDAAGLAISEKMRAQITGLNAATKNVKDGISLVKTAEGAMQEIQDMLNRMDYLATQSSNGTYDNDVDRKALQDEVNQLKDEINRIADSSNFNGIKLLDGSLDSSQAGQAQRIGSVVQLQAKGNGTKSATPQFKISLNGLRFKVASAGTAIIKVKVGTASLTFKKTVTASQVGTILGSTGWALSAAATITLGGVKFSVSTSGTVTAKTTGTYAYSRATGDNLEKVLNSEWEITAEATAKGELVDKDGNKSIYSTKPTNITTGIVKGGGQVAAAEFTITAAMLKDKAKFVIGTATYTVDYNSTNAAAGTVLGLKDLLKDGKLDDEGLAKAIDRLTKVASTNAYFKVGAKGNTIEVVQIDAKAKLVDKGSDTHAMYTADQLLSYLGYIDPGSKSLQLQIGDTSDSYNQLQVSVGDMHTLALGISDLDITTATDAADAIQTVRDAINQVSSVRGTLGAIQNRLEHTQNNLSVMAENIQDAESTIRDTDVAEEMMSYVKNNILVQSAQAMLAQANQVPQGVLQLLG